MVVHVFAALAATAIASSGAARQTDTPQVRLAANSVRNRADSLPDRRTATALAVRARPASPRIDGRLDDAAWALAPAFGDFLQREPHEGQAATERTDVRVVFTDDAIYIGVRAYDSHPDQIAANLTRRDADSPSDWIGVAIDSYHDRRTAFYFLVNPAGVKRDIYLFNDTDDDDGWDAVWEVATSRDASGWSAEFRIPFSQLRFSRGASSFGFNVTRKINRLNEETHWRLVPRNANASVSLFGELGGLEGIRPPRRLELLPYTVARASNDIAEAGNPFAPNTSQSAAAGADLKMGVGSNLTLDATINPDFGQVEADPSVVNLSAFETFYPERRPFFTEGINIFRFPILLGDGDGANEQLFYSRRVGRQPQGSADPRGGFAESVDHTNILAAAKLSGKTRSGWTIGLLGTLTREMQANVIDSAGTAHRDVVEPRSEFVVGRLARDWREGRTVVGLFGTWLHRDLPPTMQWLRRDAFTLGADFNYRFSSDHYRLRGWLVNSNVRGSAEAIASTQRSSARYYQRPDNDYTVYDTTRTSLSGFASQLVVGKENGTVRWMTGFDTRTPGFEVNDAGFQREADRTIQFAWVGLRWNTPGRVFRRVSLNFNQNSVFNWGWDRTGLGANVNANVTFLNYWSAYAGSNRNLGGYSRELRGGPLFLAPGNVNGWLGVSSDDRKRLSAEFNGWFFRQDASGGYGGGIDPAVLWRPSGRMEFSLGPSISRNHDTWQYLQTSAVLGNTEYFFGDLDQTTLSFRLRGNVTFRPTLTLQVYAEPYYSAGAYLGVQHVLDPRGAQWDDRMQYLTPNQVTRNGAGDFLVDLNNDNTTDATIANPDFSYTSFRSNVVLRWEYRPGSTIFLVWQQGRSASTSNGQYQAGDAARSMFANQPENVFLIKMNYWLSL
jgi:hypothetical protein